MAHQRSRKRIDGIGSELSMTPMIDIVFQLLIFFILTFQPEDVIAQLEVFRPRGGGGPPTPLLQIVVYPDGYTVNDRQVSRADMEHMLSRLAVIDDNQTVLIKATEHSLHQNLVEVLDLCAKVGMRNLSVVSTN
jgi:biopolymer transport protein ExbD